MIPAVYIGDIEIRQDAAGRYCLNDLHRASGGEKRHGPSYWLANAQTVALIEELIDTGNPVSTLKGGAAGEQGTFVAKELVYAYAMWISPAFHLKVIRAYDTLLRHPPNLPVPRTLPEALRLAAQAMEDAERAQADKLAAETQLKIEAARSEQLSAEVAVVAPKAAALDRLAASHEALTITQAAKVLELKRDALTTWLHANGWVYRQNGSWVPYDQHIKNGRLKLKEAKYTDQQTGQERYRPYCHVTPKGLAKLAEIFGAHESVCP